MADTYQPPNEPLYLTPDELPSGVFCRTFGVPDDPTWNALFDAALLDLMHEEAWREFGTLTPAECAEAWRVMLYESWNYSTACDVVPAPFWDETSGDDSDDTAPISDQPWYGQIVLVDDRLTFVENAFIYVVAGFIAYAGLPTAAISFVPLARQFVVTAKSNPLGGIVRFLADGVELGRTDTYSPTDGVVSTPIYMPAPTTSFVAEAVSYPTLWVELLPDNPHELASVSMTLIRSRLTPSDFSNPDYRYNSDCDCIQYSPDGGSTWRDAPGNDPRHAPQFLLPPIGGSNQQCDAAANKTKWLKDFMDSVISALAIGAIAATLINTALEFVDLLFPGAVLLELLVEFADTTFGVGDAALSAAFNSDTYAALLCIFFCDAAADGSVDAPMLAVIESDVTAQLNTTAALIVNLILGIQGEIGVSNAGAIGSETGDCSACECNHCHEYDFTVDEQGFTPFFDGSCYRAQWSSTFHGWISVSSGDCINYVQLDSPTLPDGGLNVHEILMFWPVGHVPAFDRWGLRADDVSGGAFTSLPNPDFTRTIDGETWYGFNVDTFITAFWLSGDNMGNTQLLQKLRIIYTGDEAYGGDNC